MGVILRTAGANRTKVEVKRDYEYLMRMWDAVREKTLASSAPCLVYEEGSLIKRSIRDLYGKDIDEVLVAGEEGYREAKDFMRMLMPSHAKAVQPYREPTPIFSRNGIEAQLDKMLQPNVSLKSGGYIIINQTEALVSIDVNSGRSTKEHSIESTALQTNLEAAEEVARQLRLRDLAGLVVVDFIDMMEKRNNRAVEKRLKDCLKNDRARIQVGRISHFGLLEMSRQRIRASVLESTMSPCPHCGGTGLVRADSSMALHVLRTIEETLLKDNRNDIIVRMSPDRAMMLLNVQRKSLLELEARFGVTIRVEADATISANAAHVSKGGPATPAVPSDIILRTEAPAFLEADEDPDLPAADEVSGDDEGEDDGDDAPASAGQEQRSEGGRRKRRKRRRGGRDRDDAPRSTEASGETSDDDDGEASQPRAEGQRGEGQRNDAKGDGQRRKRRRGRRSGRRFKGEFRDGREVIVPDAEPVGFSEDELAAFAASDAALEAAADAAEDEAEGDEDAALPEADSEVASEAGGKAAAPEVKAAAAAAPAKAEPVAMDVARDIASAAVNAPAAAPKAEAPASAPAEPEAARPARKRVTNADEAGTAPVVTSSVATPDGEAPKPKGGWWRRGGGFL
jgi:ribonuclease E